MLITFDSRNGVREVELRNVTGGHELAQWRNGQEREIADNDTIMFREPSGKIVRKNAIRAIFECGPSFVDSITKKNPLYSCAVCGEDALDEKFPNRATLEWVDIADADGNRLCMADFLAQHPEWIVPQRQAGIDEAVITRAQAAIADREKTAKPAVKPVVASPAPQPAQPAQPAAAAQAQGA